MIVKPTKGCTETEGRAVLKEAFTAAGFEIQEDFPMQGMGLDVTLDGWDPVRRVGYEYLTREADDRREFTEPEIARLYSKMGRGELHILLIDGEGKPDKEMIRYLAQNFLRSIVVEVVDDATEIDPTRGDPTRAERSRTR